MSLPSRVGIIGLGLIGGSIAQCLTRQGVTVTGYDVSPENLANAGDAGMVTVCHSVADAVRDAEVSVVSVPVSAVPSLVCDVLDASSGFVTDVGSVKQPILTAVSEARPDAANRFVGGHPMSGSEQVGLEGADPDLFVGATWVLTPTTHTDSAAFTSVRNLVVALGAEVVAVDATEHDLLVALVSHVPQLASTTLMDIAAASGEERSLLLRLAANGFRDMTRIAAGNPTIWPDICLANDQSILSALDRYIEALGDVRNLIAEHDSAGLMTIFERARLARRNLPTTAHKVGPLAEIRMPVSDHPGILAEVTTLAGGLGVNIVDLEVAHSAESASGVLVLLVPLTGLPSFEAALTERGFRYSASPLP